MAKGQRDDLGIVHERQETRPDFSQQALPKKDLPKSIQETLDNEEKLWSTMVDGKAADSTESDVRYAGYAARIKTILKSAHRYVAYTSDIGESFRPIAHPILVRGSYAVSWLYLAGDVANEGRKAYVSNQAILKGEASVPSALSVPKVDAGSPLQGTAATTVAAAKDLTKATPPSIRPIDDYRTVMAERAIFQSLASMGLPAFTIHSIVKYSGRYLKSSANKTLRTWGPIGLGLSTVPFLPFIFDEPVEHTIKFIFHKGFEAFENTRVTAEKKEL